jgi:hypothetical protein
MRIVVYTAILGGIDRLWAPMPGTEDVQHVAFVDAPKFEVGLWGSRPPGVLPNSGSIGSRPVWEQRIVDAPWGTRRTARHYKALPHRYLPDADVWIWVDGNVRPRVHPAEIVRRYLHGDLATYDHWDRRCLYVEAAFCAKIRKDSADVLTKQAARYRAAGMPRNWGLAATRAVIRRNTEAMRDLNEAWWGEIEHASLRDQVSLPFVCWQAGLRWDVIPGKCVLGGPGPFQYIGQHERRGR